MCDGPFPLLRAGDYAPDSTSEEGEEMLLVFVGSSTCAWSNVPKLPPLVRDVKTELQARTRAAGRRFVAVGIARDRHASVGLAYLEKFGEFDEVMSGHGWANLGIQEYVYGAGEMAGPGVTPQVILMTRRLDYPVGAVSIEDQRVILRKTGLGEISDWIAAGAPVPSLGAGN